MRDKIDMDVAPSASPLTREPTSSGTRVLFLDVDGVLNSYTRSKAFLALSKPMMKRLARVVAETGCDLVLSSSWRTDEGCVRRLNRHLRYRGCYIASHTKHLGTPRGEEIQEWLDRHPEVERYAIVDDCGGMLDSQLRSFFQTDGAHGLTDTIAHRLIHHLKDGTSAPRVSG